MIRAYNDAGNVIEVHRHKGDFRKPYKRAISGLIRRHLSR